MTYVYFPFDAVTSTIQVYPDGSLIETGLMGVEGMIGIQLWLGMPFNKDPHDRAGPRLRPPHEREEFRPRSQREPRVSSKPPESGGSAHAFLSITSLVAA